VIVTIELLRICTTHPGS